jgi:hypothetical protein
MEKLCDIVLDFDFIKNLEFKVQKNKNNMENLFDGEINERTEDNQGEDSNDNEGDEDGDTFNLEEE